MHLIINVKAHWTMAVEEEKDNQECSKVLNDQTIY